jgi:hypothetical protein
MSCGRESKLFCKALVGGSALCGFANVLAASWQKIKLKPPAGRPFFSVHRNFQRTSSVSFSNVLVTGAHHYSFFILLSPD